MCLLKALYYNSIRATGLDPFFNQQFKDSAILWF